MAISRLVARILASLAFALVVAPNADAEVVVPSDLLLYEMAYVEDGQSFPRYFWCGDRPHQPPCHDRKTVVPTFDEFKQEKERVTNLSGSINSLQQTFNNHKAWLDNTLMKKLQEMPDQIAKKETVRAMKKDLERRMDCEMKNLREAVTYELRMELATAGTRTSLGNPPVPRNCDN